MVMYRKTMKPKKLTEQRYFPEKNQKTHYHRRNTGKLLHEDSRAWRRGNM